MEQTQAVAELIRALHEEKLPFLQEEPLSRHTTFHIGGPAAVFCQPETLPELVRMRQLVGQCGAACYLLGNGSNTLFADKGFPGAVILLAKPFGRITREGNTLFAGTGAMLSAVCQQAQQAGLSGMEFASGIPGTVGGAVYMNAGAYDGSMAKVLQSVTFLDEANRLQTIGAEELALGYRTSIFEKKPWCILEAQLRLTPDAPEKIGRKMQEFLRRRKEKQPLEYPSAGSTFKRPEGAFAGKLIEECGLRGFTVGGAQISEKHCGFVINRGGATCADVLALTEQVQRIVFEKTGYRLEREIRVAGAKT